MKKFVKSLALVVAVSVSSSIVSVLMYKFVNVEESFIVVDPSTYEDLKTAKELINLQDSLLREINTHCWENHDCDTPWYDGDYYYYSDSLRAILNMPHGKQD